MNTQDYFISCIIPAFNEASRIASVIEYLIDIEDIKEIIIVDDGSTDQTEEVCCSIKSTKISVYTLDQNIGKSGAVLEGLKHALCPNILLFDADLLGLEHGYIKNLIALYRRGYDMVIMDYGAQGLWSKRIACSIPALSGVRLLKTVDLKSILIADDDKFKLETKINDYMLDNRKKIVISSADKVITPYKTDKFSFFKGLWLVFASLGDVYFANGLLASPKEWLRWRYISKQRA